jgi:hypothetical protein
MSLTRMDDDALRAEAEWMLRKAGLREDIPVERAKVFAEAALTRTDVGRNALAVIKSEPYAVRALVELALEVRKS